MGTNQTQIGLFRRAPLCDDYSILRVRLAHSDERARYQEQATSRSTMGNLAAVFLVDVDETYPTDS